MRTRIVTAEGEHADHLTTTTAHYSQFAKVKPNPQTEDRKHDK